MVLSVEKRVFETSQGPIWLWGRPSDFAPGSPLLLVITGAFTGPNYCRGWGEISGLPVLIADLPGNSCPWLKDQMPTAYGAALGEVIDQLGRKTTVCGISAGGTAALYTSSALLDWAVALDPLLSNGHSDHFWPFFLQEAAREPSPQMDRFLSQFLGVGTEELLSHRACLENRKSPAWIIGGGTNKSAPTVMSEADREAIKAAPLVRFTMIPFVGHHIIAGGSEVVLRILRGLVGSNHQNQYTG